MASIDLNADLGESFGVWRLGADEQLLDLVTSANVACGFHAGDPLTLRRTCELAADKGVRVGAQVSYRDLVGFGRRFLDVAPDDLAADVLYQLGALEAMCRAAGTRVRYVKPHGALYNAVVHHEAQAAALVEAVTAYDRALPVVGLPASALLRLAAAAGLPTVTEFFADRAYRPDGTLQPRTEPGAVLDDPGEIAARAVRLCTAGVVTAVDGAQVPTSAATICLHGDNPHAVAAAQRVRAALLDAGVSVEAFTT